MVTLDGQYCACPGVDLPRGRNIDQAYVWDDKCTVCKESTSGTMTN